jgi:glutathione peroxidase
MRLLALSLTFAAWLMPGIPAQAETACPDTLDFNFRALGEEREVNLCEAYRGKVVLVVNTASPPPVVAATPTSTTA